MKNTFVMMLLVSGFAALAQAKGDDVQELICRQEGPYYDSLAAIRLSKTTNGTYQFQAVDHTNGISSIADIDFGAPRLTGLACVINAQTFAVQCNKAGRSNSEIQLSTKVERFNDEHHTTTVDLEWNSDDHGVDGRIYYFEAAHCRTK